MDIIRTIKVKKNKSDNKISKNKFNNDKNKEEKIENKGNNYSANNNNNHLKNEIKNIRKSIKKKNTNIENEELVINNIFKNPNYWVLPNRKKFVEWVDETFKIYNTSNKKKLNLDEGYREHQLFIRSYFQMNSPYRGLLLFHSLGAGKSCSSIISAESFLREKKVCVFLPASLKKNFYEELKKYGHREYRLYHNYWFKDDNIKYGKDFPKTFKKLNYFWNIDSNQISNYNDLNEEEKNEINMQIEERIKQFYEFFNYNGLQNKRMEILEQQKDIFDNKIIIVDEVHNLISMMVGSGTIGKRLYNLFMNARNSRFIFLSGTPLINYPFELGVLFNLLQGYINTFELTISKKNYENDKELQNIFKQNIFINQIFPDYKNNKVIITQNQPLFENYMENNKYYGVKRNKNLNFITNQNFIKEIKQFLIEKRINVFKIVEKRYTCFPENIEDFNNKFINVVKNIAMNEDIFKRRILGSVSYFNNKEEFFPSKIENIVKCEMSSHQVAKYFELRSFEIEKEINSIRNIKKNQNNKDKQKSCFRVFSRQCCNFVFPDEIKRPFPTNSKNLNEEEQELLLETELDNDNHFNLQKNLNANVFIDDVYSFEDRLKKKILENKLEKERSFEQLSILKSNYLEKSKLEIYSNKFLHILNNIDKSPGTCFVYSQFRELEGIGIFSLVLEANGYAQMRIRKNELTREWEEYFENEEDENKYKFGFFTGKEEEEQRDIIKKIFNNEYDTLSYNLRKSILKRGDNKYGKCLKILLATSTAAEGINLKNTRQVHIIEPYWNPVRIEQVIGRALRYKSHIDLPEKDRVVEIFQYISYINKDDLETKKNIKKKDNSLSTDEKIDLIAFEKKKLNNSFLNLLKQSSVDCNINSFSNEKIECYNFGNYKTEYASVPNIENEILDKYKDLQNEKKTIQFQKIKFNNKEYILNPENNNIFDISSINTKRFNPIGTIKNGKIILF